MYDITVKQTKLFHFQKNCETKTDTDYFAPNHRHILEDCRCKLDQYRKFLDLSYVLNSMFYGFCRIQEVSMFQTIQQDVFAVLMYQKLHLDGRILLSVQ